MKIRVGFGFDVHQLVEGRELWLGGVLLEHTKGLLGHSDADVLLHAVCDALLGAANMLKAHIPLMQETMATVMGIDADDISIKATTTEKLGFTGREEGISAYATVLIEKTN